MEQKKPWAFIIERDPFFRLSLSKILKKYGFEVEEVEDLSQLERRKKDVETGMVLADMEIEVLEEWSPMLRKWNDRFILMTPLVSDDLTLRMKRMGIQHIVRKPVEPETLKKAIQKIPLSRPVRVRATGRLRTGSRLSGKGGEDG
jgi:DNA-binding response OmpR family regulator